eukprot:866818-Pyramimonas_sp.AAC.1
MLGQGVPSAFRRGPCLNGLLTKCLDYYLYLEGRPFSCRPLASDRLATAWAKSRWPARGS